MYSSPKARLCFLGKEIQHLNFENPPKTSDHNSETSDHTVFIKKYTDNQGKDEVFPKTQKTYCFTKYISKHLLSLFRKTDKIHEFVCPSSDIWSKPKWLLSEINIILSGHIILRNGTYIFPEDFQGGMITVIFF